MADEQTLQQPVQPEEAKGCSGNCMNCSKDQRIYCSAQIGYYINNAIGSISQTVGRLTECVAQLTAAVQEVRELQEKASVPAEAPVLMNAPVPESATERKNKKNGK